MAFINGQLHQKALSNSLRAAHGSTYKESVPTVDILDAAILVVVLQDCYPFQLIFCSSLVTTV